MTFNEDTKWNEKILQMFTSANFPLHKLKNLNFQNLFQEIRHKLPSESTVRNLIKQVALKNEQTIESNFKNKDLL